MHAKGSAYKGVSLADPSEYPAIGQALAKEKLANADLIERLSSPAAAEVEVLRSGPASDGQVAIICRHPLVTHVLLQCASPEAARQLLQALPSGEEFTIFAFQPWMDELVRDLWQGEYDGQSIYFAVDEQRFRPRGPHPARSLADSDSSLVERFGDQQAKLLFEFQLEGCGFQTFGVVEDEELISFAAVSGPKVEDLREVTWVFTRPPFRRRGHGASVLSEAVRFAISLGGAVLYHASDQNQASVALCQTVGFQELTRASAFNARATSRV